MIRSLAGVVAFVVAGLPGSAQLAVADAQAWREDLRFLAREMERTHKNLYHAISREEFAGRVESLDARIPSLERHEVVVELMRIVAAVGDGHTNLNPARDPKIGFHVLPVAFAYFGDALYVRAARERELVGAQVLRIGERDAADLFALVREVTGRDNDYGARFWAQRFLAMPELLHALRITTSPAEVPLTVSGEHGERTVVLRTFDPVVPLEGHAVKDFDRREGWIDLRDLGGRPDPPWIRGASTPYHVERIGELLYVQVNQVGDTGTETFAGFAERLRSEIAATKPAKVALDVRLNQGGDGTLIPPLIRALIQSEEIDRKGRLFAIIGPGTWSAAQMLVDALEKYTNVTFVGEPTGSKGNAYGDSRRIVLPRSGLTVRASIYWWQDWFPTDDRVATMPEIAAPLTFAAYRDGVDPAVEAILAAKPPESPSGKSR